MKRILISGDTVYDHNLIENQSTAPVKQQVFSPVTHSARPGGCFTSSN
jgi:hypothetical protein